MLDALLLVSALADSPPATAPADPATFGDQIVVTATRGEQSSARSPISVEVLDRKSLEATGTQRFDDMLRAIPGFSLLRDQSSRLAHPTTQSVSFRGLGGTSASRALVLVDGVPVNDAFGGWVPWGRIPVDDVERVEVVRSGSVLWGNLGGGGAIQVLTRPAGEVAREVRLKAGSQTTFGGSFSVGRRREGTGISLGGRLFRSDGYFRLGPEDRGPVDHRSGLRTAGADLAFDWVAANRIPMRTRVGWFDERRDGNLDGERNRVQLAYAQAGGEDLGAGAGGWSFHLFASSGSLENRVVSASEDRTSTVPSLDQYDVPGSTAGLDLAWSRRSGAHALTVGTDLQRTQGSTHEDLVWVVDRFTRRRRAGGEQLTGGLYVQDFVPIAERWSLSAALRLDSWQTRDGERKEWSRLTGALLTDSRFPDRSQRLVSPSVGATVRATRRSNLRLALYRGFRAPTPNELYKPFRAAGDVITEANAQLDPEVLEGVDLGWEWRPADRWRSNATLFWDRLEDPIQNVTIGSAGTRPGTIAPCGFVPAGGTCRQRLNLGALRSRGLEWGGEYRPSEGSRVALHYAFVDAVVIAAPGQPQLVGKRARLSPRHAGTLSGSTALAALHGTLSGQVRWLSSRYEDDLNESRIGANYAVNLAMAWQIGARWDLAAAAENLFDRRNPVGRIGSADELGIPRTVTLTLHWVPAGL